MVPAPFRDWLVEVSERACFPLEFVAVPALVAAGTVIGRGVGIMPNPFDDFLVVPNLWGALIARPGAMKSHAISEGLRPLFRLGHIAQGRFRDDVDAQGARRVRLQVEKDALKARMRQSAQKGTDDVDDLERAYLALQREIDSSVVTERRYFTHDATVESFDRLLNENPRGLLLIRDELAGWVRTFSKPGREGDREFFLEAWNGTGAFTRDRVGRGTVHIKAVTLSVVGGIQPGKLRALIEGAVQGDRNDDGLLQRIQVLVWPDDVRQWNPPQAWLSSELREQAYASFARLDQMDDLVKVAARLGHVAKVTDDGIPYLRFAPPAQDLFGVWRVKLEQRLRSNELSATPAFEAHIAKYRSLMPSLALVFHLLALDSDKTISSVSEEASSLAADWCDYLEQHARKVYASELTPGADGAKVLAAKIKTGEIYDGVSVRDISRHQWASLASIESVKSALRVLEQAGWLRVRDIETGGRPSEIVNLHPRLRRPMND
jgi:putative DNA primase/helicase